MALQQCLGLINLANFAGSQIMSNLQQETTILVCDVAMYQAKEYGRNTFRFFSGKINE